MLKLRMSIERQMLLHSYSKMLESVCDNVEQDNIEAALSRLYDMFALGEKIRISLETDKMRLFPMYLKEVLTAEKGQLIFDRQGGQRWVEKYGDYIELCWE